MILDPARRPLHLRQPRLHGAVLQRHGHSQRGGATPRAQHRHGGVRQDGSGGDVGFRRLLEDAGDAVGRGLATIGTILNPGLFVISGGMAAAGDMLLAPIQAAYFRHTLVKPGDGDGADPTFTTGRFLDNDNCMGAVGLSSGIMGGCSRHIRHA